MTNTAPDIAKIVEDIRDGLADLEPAPLIRWVVERATENHGTFIEDETGRSVCDLYFLQRDQLKGNHFVVNFNDAVRHAQHIAACNPANMKALLASHAALVEALEGMLRHSCVADADPDDKDPEDHEAERKARNIISKAKGEEA